MAISALIQAKLDDLKRELDKVPVLHRVEHAVKVPKQYLVAGVAAVLLICLLSGHGAAFICNVIGFLYPTHQSFRAIESANKKDTTQWLTYWLVYSALTIPETFSTLLAWIPFYYMFKLALLVWCFAPKYHGALTIYEQVLKGMLVKSEAKIDAVLRTSSGATSSTNDQHPAASAPPVQTMYPKID